MAEENEKLAGTGGRLSMGEELILNSGVRRPPRSNEKGGEVFQFLPITTEVVALGGDNGNIREDKFVVWKS